MYSYNITKVTGLDIAEFEHSEQYIIEFKFIKQECKIVLECNWQEQENNYCRLESVTDGYHWLQYFLCQQPNTDKLLDLDFKTEVERCQTAFSPFPIKYTQEDKNSAILIYDRPIDLEFAEIVANVIGPRFANRERFFND
jgi:hypothetical protein